MMTFPLNITGASAALIGLVLLLSAAVSEAETKTCLARTIQGVGADPGVPANEYKKPGGWQKAQNTGKKAIKRAIQDWTTRVSTDPDGYSYSWFWKDAADRFTACVYESEEKYDSGFEWGKVRCRARARPCRVKSEPPKPRAAKPKPKCAANDFRCKAKQFKYKPKFPGPQPGVRKRVIISQ